MDLFSMSNGRNVRNDVPQIRHKVQKMARNIKIKYSRIIKEQNGDDSLTDEVKDKLLTLQGEAECYVSLRKELAPYIGLDGFTNEIKGLSHKIKQQLLK